MNKEAQKKELKKTILEGTVAVFNKKGFKFTMDDVAKELSISKKTIYTIFDDKESMLMEMVDYVFDGIKSTESAILEDENLSTLEKLKKVMGALPENYKHADLKLMFSLKSKYPVIYERVEQRLETGWEDTIGLLEKGMQEGSIRPINIPIVKLMLEASLERFFQRDVLLQTGITYVEALEEVVSIIVDGIATRE